MARKKQAKTPEQRLGEALVPCEEQPYAVPDNWCWVRASAVLKPMETANPSGKSFDYIDIDAIDNKAQAIREVKTLPVEKAPSRAKRKVHDGDTLFSMVRPYLRNIAYVDSSHDDCIASTGFYVCSPNAAIDRRYLYHLLCSNYTVNGLTSFMKGDNSPSIKKGDFDSFPLPLPPLAEQRRIVERVEGLFAKLDEASQALKEMIGGSEERRSSMLRSAFNGDLTARWRAKRGMGLDSWERTTIGKCCRVGSGGTPSRKNPANYVGVIPWVKTGEINWNCIVETEEHISQDALETSSAKLYQPGAVLVAMYGMGQTRGKAALLEIPAATNQAVSVLEPDECLDRRYLYYFFMRNYWDIREQSIGGNQLNLSGTIIKQYEICLPSIEEQRAIADILENALGKEALATSAAIERLESIQAIKQRILSDALRGRLDANGSDDSNAKEQLLEMLEHQSAN